MADDDSWKTAAFRYSIAKRINEEKQKSTMISRKTELEIENFIFQRARNKAEYLGLVASLILKFQEKSAKKEPQIDPWITHYARFIPGTAQHLDEDDSWKITSFRQTMIEKLNNAIQQSGIPSSDFGKEMENHFFQKARSKDEYLGYTDCFISNISENLKIKSTKKEKPEKCRRRPYQKKSRPAGKKVGSNS